MVIFDFPGKDSIRYYNEVPVEKRVFKNLQLFIENKKGSDDLFDRLNVSYIDSDRTNERICSYRICFYCGCTVGVVLLVVNIISIEMIEFKNMK